MIGTMRRGLDALRATAIIACAALVGGGAAVMMPAAPGAEAAAAAATPAPMAVTPNVGDCDFRQSGVGSVSYKLSRQLCFLDLTGIDPAGFGQQNATRQIGPYTLSFTWETIRPALHWLWVSDDVKLDTTDDWDTVAAFGRTNADGAMFTGGSARAVVRHIGTTSSTRDRSFIRFQLTNIKVVETATGRSIPDYALNVIEAEETTQREGMSIDNGDSTYANPEGMYLSPPGFAAACGGQGGTRTENVGTNIDPSPALQRDFVCPPAPNSPTPGSFLKTYRAPTQLTVTTWTDNSQGFALALNVGRLAGAVTADTTAYPAGAANAYELAATGAETGFDLKAWNAVSTEAKPLLYVPPKGGTGAVGPQDGTATAYLRQFGAAQTNGSPNATGTLSYSSTGSNVPGGDPAAVFKRYTPTWTCLQSYGLADQTSVTLSSAGTTSQVSGGSTVSYTTVNDRAKGTSRVDITNADNVPMKCSVAWATKFKPATLSLSKLVPDSGTASGFPEVQNRTYLFNYTCALADFADAYPTVPLAGSVAIGRNDTKTMKSLPQGTSCTFAESFPEFPDPNNPGQNTTLPALPGKTLTLTWGPAPASTSVYDSYDQTHAALATKQVTLAASSSVSATNRYDYRGGTVDFTKIITGAPVRELANTTRTYDFAWACAATDKAGTFQITVTYAADGTASGTGPKLTDVPVARDCWVRATSNLTDAEAARITSLPRTVTPSGDVDAAAAAAAQARETDPNTYHFRLRDYKEPSGEDPSVITSPNASHALITLVHPYEYKTTPLSIVKRVTGTGADGARQEFGLNALFPVNYRCTYGIDVVMSGQVKVSRDENSPVTVPGVPLGASCAVWEDTANVPAGTNVEFVPRDAQGNALTRIETSDANDAQSSLTNDEAATTPIHTMHAPSGTASNRIVVVNRYDQRLGTVSVQKLVDANGITGTLPGSYSFDFTCGTRQIAGAGGAVSSASLQGVVTIAAGQTAQLIVNRGDAAGSAAVNDGPNGAMRAPYGSTCSLSERAPQNLPPGVSLTSPLTSTVQVTGAQNTATVTNTFDAAGQGLTIAQAFGGAYPGLAPTGGMSYQVTCGNGYQTTATLTAASPRLAIPAGSVPEGTSCRIVETPVDDGTRTMNGATFPTTRVSTARMPADSGTAGVDRTYGQSGQAPVGVDVTVTVGESSVLSISHRYAYVQAPVTVDKVVAFDPATEQWISDARKQVKRDRVFGVDLTCTYPTGETVAARAEISATGTSIAGQTASLGSLPQGARCTAAEEQSTSAAGVSLSRVASINGAADSDPATGDEAVAFVVGAQNAVRMTNTYSRQLVDLQLNKIAVLPESVNAAIRQLYGADLNQQLHEHGFSLDCRDPLANDVPLGTLLTGSIRGEGSTVFHGVPAGTQCHIAGDGFTQLDLADSSTGRPLESHFRTASVEWIVDENAATTYVDRDVAGDGVTESNYFTIPSDGTTSHRVDLRNNYDFVMTSITRSKQVVASQEGLDLLAAADPSYSFTFRCEGVGYGDWTGANDASFPNPLAYSQITGDPVSQGAPAPGSPERFSRTFTSNGASVPAGALCSSTELPPSATPAQLVETTRWIDASGALVTGDTMSMRAPGGSEAGASDFAFVNDYTRRMAPVRLAMLHSGYLEGAAAAGYSLTATCTDPASTSTSTTVPLNQAMADATVSQGSAPAQGAIVMLPAGAHCTLDLGGSPALQARPELAPTQGERTPFVEFGLWDASGDPYPADPSAASNPAVSPEDNRPYDDAHVTPVMKQYRLGFDIPADAAAPAGQPAALTVAAEAMHPRATADVAVTKLAAGEIADGARFTFESTCLPGGSAQIGAGETLTLPNVPVHNECRVVEADDGVADSEAQISVRDRGELLVLDPAEGVVNDPAQPDPNGGPATPGEHSVTFEVQPVTAASDLARSGPRWSMTLVNTYPAIVLEKEIAGARTLLPADHAILPADATTFDVTYRIRNRGGAPIDAIAIVDPSLAGRTVSLVDRSVSRDGAPDAVVPPDGTVDPALCGFGAGQTIAPGATLTCTLRASIAEPAPALVEIPGGPATVTATSAGVQVQAQDAFSATRPVLGALPDAGVQTLVWALVIGAGVLLFGLWRGRRRRDDEPPAKAVE